MEKHFRVPIADAIRRKSPFARLLEHMEKVKECMDVVREGLIRYYNGEYEGFSEVAEKVSKLEHEADLIKGNIRAHLPRTILMPVDKGQFLWLL
ncbi:MAG: DUF47 domain-containing protein, partial [Thermoplasmata archaeon]